MYDFFNRGIEFRLGDLPVTINWTVFLVFLDVFTYRAYPVVILIDLASFVAIVLVHELGHAYFCWRRKYRVEGILLHYWGGVCVHEPAEYRRDEVAIAAGGVVFQVGLAVLALGAVFGLGPGLHPYLSFLLVQRLIRWNLFTAAFNLIPIPGFDGYTLYHAIDWEGVKYRLGIGMRGQKAWRRKGKALAKAEARKAGAAGTRTAGKDASGKAGADTASGKAPRTAAPDQGQVRRLADEIMAEAKREYDKGKD